MKVNNLIFSILKCNFQITRYFIYSILLDTVYSMNVSVTFIMFSVKSLLILNSLTIPVDSISEFGVGFLSYFFDKYPFFQNIYKKIMYVNDIVLHVQSTFYNGFFVLF